MRKLLLLSLLLLASAYILYAQHITSNGYPISPVPFTSVKVSDVFWGQRLRASREITIPLAFSKCKETGRYENFVRAAHPNKNYLVEGFSFDDTDVYKTIEGASYLMQSFPDKKQDAYIDSILLLVSKAQEADGYLYTARTMNPDKPHAWSGKKRWEQEEVLSHELYDLGHMIEAAIAHYQCTHKRNFLDIAIRYADCAQRAIGDGQAKVAVVPGHQIAEMALCKLYVVTGDKRYLDFAKYLLDKRGLTAHKETYNQSHLPVVRQTEAVGHAVRAAYMYTGMADVAALTGDTAYLHAIDRIWSNIVSAKMYLTGGIGSTSDGEAFGKNYELPNMAAYCETCAAIGSVYLNYRLFLLHGDARYFDVLERTLYNGVLSGVSLDGGGFFYPNPLESMGQHQRQPWFGCACCPSNICRFIPSVPGYVYAVRQKDVYVNLYMSNTVSLDVDGSKLVLSQSTRYPLDGDIRLVVGSNAAFNLRLRIPGWVRGQVVPSDLYSFADNKQLNFTIKVNGGVVCPSTDKGYCSINRKWRKNDIVEIHFDMIPRLVSANSKVVSDRGRVAVERGPLLYCAEWADNQFSIHGLLCPLVPVFHEKVCPDLLGGIVMIQADAQALDYSAVNKLQVHDVQLNLIPYYAWAHRGSGEMSVWLPTELAAMRTVRSSSTRMGAQLSASVQTSSLFAVNDRFVPENENDLSIPYFSWLPDKNKIEWIQYNFSSARTLESASVYWFDDAPWGQCRTPSWWKLLYMADDGSWKPVEATTGYQTVRAQKCTVRFNPVVTRALKMELQLPEKYSSGIYEWEVQ